MYAKTTRSIRVSAQPAYLDEQSNPAESYYVWAYRIRIENRGTDTVRLLNRYWHITDALGRVQEVRGEGVVGKQPVLGPGETFEYTSACPLPTPSGIMVGSYEMQDGQGELFAVDIPGFSLDIPDTPRRLN